MTFLIFLYKHILVCLLLLLSLHLHHKLLVVVNAHLLHLLVNQHLLVLEHKLTGLQLLLLLDKLLVDLTKHRWLLELRVFQEILLVWDLQKHVLLWCLLRLVVWVVNELLVHLL